MTVEVLLVSLANALDATERIFLLRPKRRLHYSASIMDNFKIEYDIARMPVHIKL